MWYALLSFRSCCLVLKSSHIFGRRLVCSSEFMLARPTYIYMWIHASLFWMCWYLSHVFDLLKWICNLARLTSTNRCYSTNNLLGKTYQIWFYWWRPRLYLWIIVQRWDTLYTLLFNSQLCCKATCLTLEIHTGCSRPKYRHLWRQPTTQYT